MESCTTTCSSSLLVCLFVVRVIRFQFHALHDVQSNFDFSVIFTRYFLPADIVTSSSFLISWFLVLTRPFMDLT